MLPIDEEVHVAETATLGLKLSLPLILTEVGEVIFNLRWFILAAFALIMADLWFGIQVSIKKGIEIRRSSAGRRTFNKFIDYILYVVLGTTLSMAIAPTWNLNPLHIASVILILCYAFEMDSIYSHICYLHGAKKKVSIFKIIWYIITLRFKELKNLDSLKPDEPEVDHLKQPSSQNTKTNNWNENVL